MTAFHNVRDEKELLHSIAAAIPFNLLKKNPQKKNIALRRICIWKSMRHINNHLLKIIKKEK